MKKYNGPLVYKKMCPEVKKAYITFHNIITRTKKFGWNSPDFTVREFIHWLVSEKKRLKLNSPSLSRYDHSKGYTWDNFILEELIDNIKESAQRNDFKKHNIPRFVKIEVFDRKSGDPLFSCACIRNAAFLTKVDPKYVKLCAENLIKKPKKLFGYRYIGNQK